MGKFDGVLLASDFDNTLIYTEAALRAGAPIPPLSPGNREALEYFIGNGGYFTVSTGRALGSFSRPVRDLPINVPAVICNGAAIYDFQKNEYLEVALLDADALRRGQILMDAFPDVACEAYHIGNTIHTIHPNEVTRHHIHMTHVNVEERTSLLEVPLPLGKLLFEAEHDRLEAALAFMQSNGWTAVYELVFSSPYMLEMTRKDASKGGMIRRLAARLHVDPSHLYCAGDEANDLSMLQVAAEGFAPANCVPAVRKSGATIVADARQNAMADIVSILDQRY